MLHSNKLCNYDSNTIKRYYTKSLFVVSVWIAQRNVESPYFFDECAYLFYCTKTWHNEGITGY